jgi:hypothetical protein
MELGRIGALDAVSLWAIVFPTDLLFSLDAPSDSTTDAPGPDNPQS